MSRHLKKYAAPKSWNVQRKDLKFIKKPNPGPYNQTLSQSIDLTLRMLNLAKTAREVKKILNSSAVFVDGRKVKDPKFPVGLFAILSFQSTKKHYRMMLDKKGRLLPLPITSEHAQVKVCKIINKTTLQKGTIQVNCSDGRNMIMKSCTYKVGDSLIIDVSNQTIKEHLPFAPSAEIMLIAGKQSGVRGILTGILQHTISYKEGEQESETRKQYAFVIGPSKTLSLP